jgi:hypothetical protein
VKSAIQFDVKPVDLIVDKARFGARLLATARNPSGARHRHADHHRRRDQRMLRINGTRRNADEVQVIFVAVGHPLLIDVEHKVTLNNMVMLFADVMTTQELIGFVDKAAAMQQAAEWPP